MSRVTVVRKDGRKSYIYRDGARILGSTMAKEGIRLVYGGGGSGIMGAVAHAVRAGGGDITGIIPEFLIPKERGNMGSDGLSDELGDVIVTKNMHERKTKLFERSDAFVALPGGIGTLEELVEMLTWAQLGRHEHPVVLANLSGFWDPLIMLLDHMITQKFMTSNIRRFYGVVDQVDDILPRIEAAL